MLDKVLKNQKKADDKLSKERDARCEPMAAAMVQILAKANIDPSITNLPEDHARMLEAYTPVYQEIMALALEKNLSVVDMHYVLSIFLSYFEFTKTLVERSLKHNLNLCEEKIWGKPINDLTLQDLDGILKSQKTVAT